MSPNEQPPSAHDEHRRRQLFGPGLAFLGCGLTFLGAGMVTKMFAFTVLAPTFVALGVVFIALSRRRPGDGPR